MNVSSKLLVVAVALLDNSGRVLVQKRPEGRPMAGLWEFPGGKIEAGETPEQALVREVKEELGILLDRRSLRPVAFATEEAGDRSMILLLYRASTWGGVPQALDGQELQWIALDALHTLRMPPADGPLIAQLRQNATVAAPSQSDN
jgi:8-oxo-dGTP diphosphatase